MDLRVRKVYDALTQALIDLLEEKDFSQITVKELCNKARTRTATFYNHFSDKYEFFSFVVQEKREELIKNAITDDTPDHPEEVYLGFIRAVLAYVEEHKNMARHISNDLLLSAIMGTITPEVKEQLTRHFGLDFFGSNQEQDNEIALQMFIGALSQCIWWWLQNNENVSKESIINHFRILLRNILRAS